MKLPLVFVLLLILAIGCKSIPRDHYEHERLTFKISDDFYIVKPRTWKHNQATYIRINRRDVNSYGKISVTWLPKEYDLDKEVKNCMDTFAEFYDSDEHRVQYSAVSDGEFASNKTRYFGYNITNDPATGFYRTFHCNGLTIIMGVHYNAETEAATMKCVKVMEDSFTCKSNTTL